MQVVDFYEVNEGDNWFLGVDIEIRAVHQKDPWKFPHIDW